jgi:hypothetical protein
MPDEIMARPSVAIRTLLEMACLPAVGAIHEKMFAFNRERSFDGFTHVSRSPRQ